MKYIDAEKLVAEIERRKEEYKKDRYMSDYRGQIAYYKDEIYDDLLYFIDSLQQEQPDCHTVEDWIQHIKNADQLTKDIFSKGPYDVLYDALNHPYQHCYDAIKEFGELCFQTGANSVKQEQPEVEFEDKFAKFIEKKDAELGANTWSEEDLRELALYFYYSRNEDKQPEVDLEKEYKEYVEDDLVFSILTNRNVGLAIARHFYELGKNSK